MKTNPTPSTYNPIVQDYYCALSTLFITCQHIREHPDALQSMTAKFKHTPFKLFNELYPAISYTDFPKNQQQLITALDRSLKRINVHAAHDTLTEEMLINIVDTLYVKYNGKKPSYEPFIPPEK